MAEYPDSADENADDRFLILVLRYFDGDLDAAELKELNGILRGNETSRRRFIEFCTRGCLIRETFAPERQAALRREEPVATTVVAQQKGILNKALARVIRKRRWLAAAALAACLMMVVTTAFITRWFSGRNGAGPIGFLEQVAGDVRVLAAGGKVQAVDSGMPIRSGDTVRTSGGQAGAVLVYPDGTRVRLVGNTSVTCTDRGQKSVVVHQGTVAVSAKPQPKIQPLLLATSMAQLQVVGTQFLIKTLPEQTDLNVLEGRVRVTRVHDGKTVEVAEGKRLLTVERADLVVQDIAKAPDTWDLDFEEGPPKDFVESEHGRFVKDGLPPGSKGAVGSVPKDVGGEGIFFQIASPERWFHGLFTMHADSHLHFTFKIEKPQWINVFLLARNADPNGPALDNYLFNRPFWATQPGKWRTVTVPLSEFTGHGRPPGLHEIPWMILFSSLGDRGLVIDRIWVTRGGPGVIRYQDLD